MELKEKRVILLIDEMSVSEAIWFDSKSFKYKGFVDHVKQTSAQDYAKTADHGAVFMIQPLQGDWVQIVGTFPSKTAVTQDPLKGLIEECIKKLGEAGFKTDGVCTDAASWNRGVWTQLKMSADAVSYCENPYKFPKDHLFYEEDSKLYFFSDGPHLVKTLRNF